MLLQKIQAFEDRDRMIADEENEQDYVCLGIFELLEMKEGLIEMVKKFKSENTDFNESMYRSKSTLGFSRLSPRFSDYTSLNHTINPLDRSKGRRSSMMRAT